MKTSIIACRTIEDELRYTMIKTGISYPITWLDPGLHNLPQKLNASLQAAINALEADRVLMTLGACGNSLVGLNTGLHTLIFPRVDDCISLLLGGIDKRQEISHRYAAYFLTEGWLRGERNLWTEYLQMQEIYGEEIAEELRDAMYGNYRSLGLLDTPAVSFSRLEEDTRKIAAALHLSLVRITGSTEYLEQLLTGPWPEEKFIRKDPHTIISQTDMLLAAQLG